MADIVQCQVEEAIPELEAMMKVLFTEEEGRHLVAMRKDLEHKVHKPQKNKEDCLKYIDHELKLLRMVRFRHKKKNLPRSDLANIEMEISNRVNKMFIFTIRFFPEDLMVWLSYFRFCKFNGMYAATSRVLEQMLSYHGSANADLYKFAADWELTECKSIDKARKYLMSGIHIHKDDKSLSKEHFHLELIDAAQKRKECAINSIPIDPANTVLSSKRAECIYECYIKRFKDIELMNEVMNICAEYDFASALQTKIYSEMFEFENCERMWDIVATKELNSDTDGKQSAKARIGKCVELYEAAVVRLNTPTMWNYYIEALTELLKDTTVLPNYKRKLLMTAFEKAATNEKLTEKHFLLWTSFLQGVDKHKKLVEVLQKGVNLLPQSTKLWDLLVRAHLLRGEEKQANQTFDLAVEALGKDSLSLWELMLMYEQTKRNCKVEEIFKKSLNHCTEITNVMKPMYLEWLVLTHSIGAARQVYGELVDSTPPSLEVHKKMIYLEHIQPTLNMKRMRRAYTRACADFGDRDIGVWLDICKFEIEFGDADRLVGIHNEAKQNLVPQLVERFLSEYSLIRTMPQPPIDLTMGVVDVKH